MSLECVAVWDTRVVVFDLEWLGDLRQPSTTRIFSIGAVHPATRSTFSVVVDPAVSARRLRRYETFAGCRRVTRGWLRRNHAVSFAQAFQRFRDFVFRCVTRAAPGVASETLASCASEVPAVLVAHGCFRADLPVLKSALRRCNVTPPPFWRFMDSLMFFRRALHPAPPQFTLQAVAATLGVPPCARAHDALPDALMLHACLVKFPHLYGVLYNFWQTPLTTIPGVGLRNQTLLLRGGGLRSVEDVLNFAQRAQENAGGVVSAVDRLTLGFARFGLTTTARRVAQWCVDTLVVFDEISADYK